MVQVNVSGADPVSCGCRPGHLAWTDGVCYLRFSPGPCGQGGVSTYSHHHLSPSHRDPADRAG